MLWTPASCPSINGKRLCNCTVAHWIVRRLRFFLLKARRNPIEPRFPGANRFRSHLGDGIHEGSGLI